MSKNPKGSEIEGEVVETLPDLHFKVKTNDNRLILAHLAGKMRLHHIRILAGDKVKVELSPYDNTKGRIVYRHR